MTIWATDQSGKSASTTYADGSRESRLLSAIPATDTIIAASLSIIQSKQLSLIENAYQVAISDNIAYMGTTFQADKDSQSLLAHTLSALAGASPTGFGWYDINNVKIPMTNAQLQGLANAIATRGIPLFDHKQTQKAAIRAALTNAQVEAIIW